jgi:hypothetical protein
MLSVATSKYCQHNNPLQHLTFIITITQLCFLLLERERERERERESCLLSPKKRENEVTVIRQLAALQCTSDQTFCWQKHHFQLNSPVDLSLPKD